MMTQSASNLQASQRAPLHLLALARARDKNHRPLAGTASWLYLLLLALGEKGEYPDTAKLIAALDVHRDSIWRAEKSLQASGLLTLSMAGKAHSRRRGTYVLNMPDRITFAQQQAWKMMSEPEARSADNTPDSAEIIPQESPADPAPAAAATEATTSPSTPPVETTPAPREKTVDLQVAEWFLASPEKMDLYLRFGTDAYGKTQQECEATLKSTGTDWQAFRLPAFATWPADVQANYLLYPFPKNEEGIWTNNHFCGYFWQGVCRWRAKHNIPLTFPRWDRLCGEVKNLLATTIPYNAYTFIYFTIEHFDLIRFQAGKIGSSMILDEAALNHKIIRDHVLVIASYGHQQLVGEYERMADANRSRSSTA